MGFFSYTVSTTKKKIFLVDLKMSIYYTFAMSILTVYSYEIKKV